MTTMQIIVDEKNHVLGTLVVAGGASGEAAPHTYGAQAGPGQRILEVTVDDSLSALAPDELHAALAKQHLS